MLTGKSELYHYVGTVPLEPHQNADPGIGRERLQLHRIFAVAWLLPWYARARTQERVSGFNSCRSFKKLADS